MAHPNQPIIIGVGQSVVRELSETAADLPTPITLATDACRAALEDTGVNNIAAHIDTLAFVRTNGDSVAALPHPLGRCNNPPRAVAANIGANPARAVYSLVGGQAPQQLVNETVNRIAAGESTVTLLTGAEAIGAMKHIVRNKLEVNWNEEVDGELDERGLGPELISRYEISNGMGFPPQVYGAFENAWRHSQGMSKDENRQRMSELFARFSEVAATHPYAQFPTARAVEFLATPSYENYDIADPYLKWHVAQDAVNQGAALILTSVAKARELGVPEERWVYPLAGADGQDKLVSARERLDASYAMKVVLEQTLTQGGMAIDDIAHLDLYSCFPCAVQFACDALGIDPFSRQLTQTGGLPFFGGAGNNYTMHAIASIIDTLRDDPGSYGLILGNGGFTSKESAGLYSTQAPADWQPVDNTAVKAAIDDAPEVPIVEADQPGTIESYGVVYNKAEPFIGYVFCRTADGGRFMARSARGDQATLRTLVEDDPMGVSIQVEQTEKYNLLALR